MQVQSKSYCCCNTHITYNNFSVEETGYEQLTHNAFCLTAEDMRIGFQMLVKKILKPYNNIIPPFDLDFGYYCSIIGEYYINHSETETNLSLSWWRNNCQRFDEFDEFYEFY